MDNFQLTLLQHHPHPKTTTITTTNTEGLPVRTEEAIRGMDAAGFSRAGPHLGGCQLLKCYIFINYLARNVIGVIQHRPTSLSQCHHRKVCVPPGEKKGEKYLAEITPSGTKHIIKLHFLVLNSFCTCRSRR